MGPLHLEITSYKKRHAAGQMTLWDIENKLKKPSLNLNVLVLHL